jgi:hypothetical protein
VLTAYKQFAKVEQHILRATQLVETHGAIGTRPHARLLHAVAMLRAVQGLHLLCAGIIMPTVPTPLDYASPKPPDRRNWRNLVWIVGSVAGLALLVFVFCLMMGLFISN